MRRMISVQAVLMFLSAAVPVFAGDSAYGTVKDVRTANVVLLAVGNAQYVVHLVGVDSPKEGAIAEEAKQFVVHLVLGKHARFYLYGKVKGEFVSALLTADPDSGFKDVGIELVRAGLARAVPNDFYKDGSLEAAEKEAKERGRGVWARQ